MVSRAHTLVVGLVVITACKSKDAEAWIGERSAVIRCTDAGRDRVPPVLIDIPAPEPPSGLLARAVDPAALDGLGYQRDQPACAVLVAPTEELVDESDERLDDLVAAYEKGSEDALAVAGRCTCAAAQSLGLRELVEACRETPTQRGCDASQAPQVEAALAPLLDAIEETSPPVVHWRLAGRTDRPGWLAERLDSLIARHAGGSTIYRRGEAVPVRDNYELLRALLDADDVVAVVRQDGGRALLVAREIGKTLVLDHFQYVGVHPLREPLLSYLDNAHAADYLQHLDPPQQRRKPGLDPTKGNLVEIDRPLLERVDALVQASAPLAAAEYDASAETWDEPDVLVDRVTVQAPFGAQGQALVMRLQLSDAGTLWAQTLGDQVLSPTLDELGLAGRGPSFTPPALAELEFVLRGQPVNTYLVHGLHLMPVLLSELEMNNPSTIQGKADAWRFELPALDPTPGATELGGLREALAARPYVVQSELDAAREVLRIELAPR